MVSASIASHSHDQTSVIGRDDSELTTTRSAFGLSAVRKK
jgi:hypothetical protein